MNVAKVILLFLLCLLCTTLLPIAAQSLADTTFYKSKSDTTIFIDRALDFFEFSINETAIKRNPATYPAKLVLAPIISYTPETNWGVGIGAKLLFKFSKSGKETRTSNMPLSALYTLNNQLLLSSGYTIFFNGEKYLLKGNLLFSKFPQLFYGMGNNTPKSNEELFSYHSFLVEPLLLRRLSGKLFLGGGIRYYSIWKVHIEQEGLLSTSRPEGYQGSRSMGVELALTYDSRNNVLNASKGMLAEFTHGRYDKWIGGTNRFQLTKFDIRQYFKLFPYRSHVLAFQLYGYFTSGSVPLIELASLGGNELMRGYYEGRYSDRNLLAGQVEYRLPLSGRMGMVLFAGAGQVAEKINGFRFSHLKPSLGAGLRFKIVKEENLNVRFDYGIGKGAQNYYFNIAEAF